MNSFQGLASENVRPISNHTSKRKTDMRTNKCHKAKQGGSMIEVGGGEQ